MLKLKVNQFMIEHRKAFKEKLIQKRRLNFKIQNMDDCYFHDIYQCNFAEEELHSLQEEAFKNQAKCLKQRAISKLLYFYNNHAAQAKQHYPIILRILEILTQKLDSPIYQEEQIKAEIFFIDVLKQQRIELIDIAIKGLYNLSQIPQTIFLQQRDLFPIIIDLLNLQIIDIPIDKVSFILIKLIKFLSYLEIQGIVSTPQFNNTLLFYLKLDKSVLINLILHIVQKQISLQLFSNYEFFVFLMECLETKDTQQLLKVVFFIKYTIFEISCKHYLLLEDKLRSIKKLGNESLNIYIMDILENLMREKQKREIQSNS